MSNPSSTRVPIAVVGVSALFPGSTDAEGFWRDILAGSDLTSDVPPSHWLIDDYYDADPKAPDKTYAKRGAFLGDVPFDPMEFGVPPSIVSATDTSQLLGLIVAQRVLRDATQGQFADMDRARCSVILGVTSGQELLASMVSRLQRPVWVKSLREAGIAETKVDEICDRIADHYVPWQESSFPGLLGNVVAGRIANRLDLGGTNCVTDAACASALSALSMAVNELYLGEADLVISGGVDTLNDIFMYMCFSKTPALSATQDCRPFADDADGTLLGEGLGMIALKRLEDAERDGDRIYAVVRGLGTSSDGRAKSVYAPRPEGQAKALRRAYELAGYGPDTVELLEAHGTATKAGDAAEFEALHAVFDETGRAERQWCALGSVKSQIGHTKAAAGAAGLFKGVMALHHKVLPPTIKVARPNQALCIDQSPFYLNTEARPWVRCGDHPRRASVSSFGFGGSNFHVALEEYRGPAPRASRKRVVPDEVVVFCADAAADLVARLRDVDVCTGSLSWLARHTQQAYDGSAAVRAAIVATGDDDLRAKLIEAANQIEARPEQPFSSPRGIHYGCGAHSGKVAWLFPGQGSQYVGMGADVAMTYSVALELWDLAATLDFGDRRLHDVVFAKPVFDDQAKEQQHETLKDTAWAQPAIGATSMSLLALLRRVGVEADAVAGHSFGEVSALFAAGAFDAATALRVAQVRGELMAAAASSSGAMTAVSATLDEVRAIADSHDVVVANHNAPRQVVLSGSVEAIVEVEAALAAAGLGAKRLPVATAFHSPIVRGSTEPFAQALAGVEVRTPSMAVYSNATAAPFPEDPGGIRRALARQIAEPVRFVEQIQAMYDAGVRTFIEVGPGAVLSGLVGRILEEREHLALSLDHKGKRGLSSWHQALARLMAAGLDMTLAPLWTDYADVDDPRTAAPPKMTLSINGTNYGKPYPPPEGAAALPPPNSDTPLNSTTTEVNVSESKPSNGAAKSNGSTVIRPSEPMTTQVAPVASVAPDAWVFAYQEAQRQTAEAHTAFQNAMAQAHMAYLHTAESAFEGLVAMATGVASRTAGASRAAYVPQILSAPVASAPVASAPVASAPVASAPVASAPVASAPVTAAPAPPMPVPVAPAAETTQPVAATPAVADPVGEPLDAEGLMLDVVADKTGYPAEMLAMDMALEADLGIDSIKRVEILSEIMKRRPDLPEVDTKKMASLNTLGEIAEYIRSHLASAGGGAVTHAEPPRPKASSAATP